MTKFLLARLVCIGVITVATVTRRPVHDDVWINVIFALGLRWTSDRGNDT